MVAEYDRRRRMFVAGLERLGLPTAEPRGAFYAFPRIAGTRSHQRRLQRAPALRAPGRGHPGHAPSGPAARATCGPRWRPRYEKLEEALRAHRALRCRLTPRARRAGERSRRTAVRPLRGGHRHRDPRPAADRLQDVLRLLQRLRGGARRTPTPARSAWACRARCRSSTGRPCGTCWPRAWPSRPPPARHALGPQELLLPGPAQGLPDQPVRAAAGARPAVSSWRPRAASVEVGITRAHLEEDTARLLHTRLGGRPVSLLDYDRSGHAAHGDRHATRSSTTPRRRAATPRSCACCW